MLKSLFALALLTLSGCAMYDSVRERVSPVARQEADERRAKEAIQHARKRVVYTPLIAGKAPTDQEKVEILLRPPKKDFREIGLISMYREHDRETAADLLPWMRQRAAEEGADAILLMEIEDKTVGTYTQGGAAAWGDAVFASASTTAIKEGTIRGVAIVYGE